MNDQIDASIPVLTEILQANKIETSLPKTIAVGPAIAVTKTNPTPTPIQPMTEVKTGLNAETVLELTPVAQDALVLSAEDFEAMEMKLRENVLKQVLTRVDFVLEHRVRDSLAEVLQTAVDQLADEIRSGLKQSLQEVVTRAVNQELSKLQSRK